MSFESITPNMNLIVPGVGLTSGPQYAVDLNNTLTIIDGHNHSPGNGVAIGPSGLNISSDLTFNSNSLTNAKSVQFTPNLAPLSSLGSIYESGVDLYYTDGNGNQIRITQSGNVAGSSGSITGLVAPASATYVAMNSTFVWQSNANTPANMDFGSAIFRNVVANSKGVTVQAAAALAADYTLTLPLLPPSLSLLTLDNTGTFGYTNFDNVTITSIANVLQVKNQGIGQPQLAPRPVGTSAGNISYSPTSGNSLVVTAPDPNGSIVAVPTLATTLTTLGRPVRIDLLPTAGVTTSASRVNSTGIIAIQLLRGATVIASIRPVPASASGTVPYLTLDIVAAGTYTYSLQLYTLTGGGGGDVTFENVQLVAYEL